MAQDKKTVTVSCCAECPFLNTNPLGCNENPEAGIDTEFIDDDISALCPMMDGSVKSNGNDWVKLADWLLKKDDNNLDD